MIPQQLINDIKANDGVSIAQFMDFCLLDKNHGYYRQGKPLGREGDFVTSPEISQLFGEIIGIWLLNHLERVQLKQNQQISLIELGPGSGKLINDVIRVLSLRPNYLKKINLRLLEINKDLILQQKQNINFAEIFHYQSLKQIKENVQDDFCLIIANEFLDTLPVNQYFYQTQKINKPSQQLYERFINYDKNGKLQFTTKLVKPIVAENILSFFDIEHLQNNISNITKPILEISPILNEYLSNIMDILQTNGGLGLIIDYGYLSPKYKNTLQGIYKHKIINPLSNLGKCDLSCHVNFSHLVQLLRNYKKFHTHITTQREFLNAYGIQYRSQILCQNSNAHIAKKIQQSMIRLLDSQQMGTLFKVLQIVS